MRPTQTIDQALTDGDSAVGPLLTLWLEREQSTRSASPARRPGPYEIRISFQQPGEARKSVLDLAWTSDQAVGAAVPGLAGAIKERLLEQYGPSPIGKLRVFVYHAGESGRTDLSFIADRSLAPGVDELAAGGDVVYLRLQNQQLHNTIVGICGHLVVALQHSNALAAEHGKTIGTLSTARTAGSSAADSGGIWGVASLLAVAVTWPILQDAMGAKGATLPDMLRLFQAQVAGALKGDARREVIEVQLAGEPPTPPAGLVTDATATGTAEVPAITPEQARDLAQRDPKFVTQFARLIKADAALSKDMLAAFAAA